MEGVCRFTSEKAVRGASPNCLVKMSKMHARQTRVVYSVMVPGGNSLRSSSRFFVAAMRGFNHKVLNEVSITRVIGWLGANVDGVCGFAAAQCGKPPAYPLGGLVFS